MKSSMQYPRLHSIRSTRVLIIEVAEGDGNKDDPIHLVEYVAEPIEEGGYKIIGELYNA